MPVFEGLFPEPHNSLIMKLLFVFAHWQGLAKLRMHTDATLDILKRATKLLGSLFRDFEQTTCSQYSTRELVREAASRQRRSQSHTSAARRPNHPSLHPPHAPASSFPAGDTPTAGGVSTAGFAGHPSCTTPADLHSDIPAGTSLPPPHNPDALLSIPIPPAVVSSSRRKKTFNLNTAKLHFLGDYVSSISAFGTTDSYSTETVCVLTSVFYHGC